MNQETVEFAEDDTIFPLEQIPTSNISTSKTVTTFFHISTRLNTTEQSYGIQPLLRTSLADLTRFYCMARF